MTSTVAGVSRGVRPSRLALSATTLVLSGVVLARPLVRGQNRRRDRPRSGLYARRRAASPLLPARRHDMNLLELLGILFRLRARLRGTGARRDQREKRQNSRGQDQNTQAALGRKVISQTLQQTESAPSHRRPPSEPQKPRPLQHDFARNGTGAAARFTPCAAASTRPNPSPRRSA